ncbi:MAG: NAD(P)-dependent alcohol dehydrogenase [Ruminiclostridium sp.]
MENYAAFLTDLKKFEIRKTDMPVVRPGTVMVKIDYVGICGSDVHFFEHGKIGEFAVKYPYILGHECSGTVTEVANDVSSLKVGDKVALEPGIPCGKCTQCLNGKYNLCPDVIFFATPPYDGANQNYVVHPTEWTFKLSDNMSTLEGALIEPLAVGLHAVRQGGVSLGDTVLIFGAGCIGLVTLLSAKAAGATKVIVVDVLKMRLDKAEKLGAITINAAEQDVVSVVKAMTKECGVDVVIDAAGTQQTLTTAPFIAKRGGTIVMVGQATDTVDKFPINAILVRELNIKSVFRYRNIYPMAINAIAGGFIDIKSIVSHIYPFERIQEAFDYVIENKQSIVKGVIDFTKDQKE